MEKVAAVAEFVQVVVVFVPAMFEVYFVRKYLRPKNSSYNPQNRLESTVVFIVFNQTRT